MEEKHTVAKQRPIVSPDCLFQVFSTAPYLSALTLCIRSDSNTHVVGSKSFWPDIQKPRQMENAVRDI